MQIPLFGITITTIKPRQGGQAFNQFASFQQSKDDLANPLYFLYL